DAGVRLADAQPGVGPRLARRDHADQRRARIPLRIGAIAGIPDVVAVERGHVGDGDAADRRGDAAREVRRVELGDRARAAASAADRLPEPLASSAKRRHDTDTGDDDARTGRSHDAIVAPQMLARPVVWLGGALFVAALTL